MTPNVEGRLFYICLLWSFCTFSEYLSSTAQCWKQGIGLDISLFQFSMAISMFLLNTCLGKLKSSYFLQKLIAYINYILFLETSWHKFLWKYRCLDLNFLKDLTLLWCLSSSLVRSICFCGGISSYLLNIVISVNVWLIRPSKDILTVPKYLCKYRRGSCKCLCSSCKPSAPTEVNHFYRIWGKLHLIGSGLYFAGVSSPDYLRPRHCIFIAAF